MKSALRSFLILIFALLGSTAIFIMLKNKHEDSSTDLEKRLPKKTIRSPNIREIAESKVDIDAILNSVNSNSDVHETVLDPQNLKKECKNVGIEIAKISISDISSSFLNSTDHLTCLREYGFDLACADKIDETFCKKNITTTRAKIIAEISNHLPINNLTPEIAANRAISLIFSPQSAQNNAEIYQLSSILLEKFPDLEEAHNLRSFYGFQSVKDKWDTSKIAAINASADILKSSPDSENHKKGEMIAYATGILKYYNFKAAEDLESSEAIANSYVSSFPSDPIGYYMLMQISGFKGEGKNALKYIEKGLSFGPNQQFYDQYLQVKKSLESGAVDVNILGLRVDFDSYFKVENLLESEQ